MLTALTGYNNVISTTLRLTGAARLVEIVSISDYVMRSYCVAQHNNTCAINKILTGFPSKKVTH